MKLKIQKAIDNEVLNWSLTHNRLSAVIECGIQIAISVYREYVETRFPSVSHNHHPLPCPPGSCVCPEWKSSSLLRVPLAHLEAGLAKNQDCAAIGTKAPISSYFLPLFLHWHSWNAFHSQFSCLRSLTTPGDTFLMEQGVRVEYFFQI